MKKTNVRQMVGVAVLSAIVVVLQLLGSFIKIGPLVSVTLVLVPIVVGAAVYGPGAGAFLGGVFAVVVLLQPDTVFFHNITVLGTVLTVVVKGILSGWLSGVLYRLLRKVNEWLAVLVAAAVCPLVNTGVFILGCRLFFWDALAELGSGDAVTYLFTVMIGANFIGEFVANLICSPVIMRILQAIKRI